MGRMDLFADVAQEAAAPPAGVDPAVCLRAVTVASVQRVAASDSEKTKAIMNCLAEAQILQALPDKDVGILLDLLVRGMLCRGDVSNAFRGELLSRLLETRLRRGTYSSLIERSGKLELGLAVFHRAIATGIEPNRKMLHAVLGLCFSAGDGARARAVMAEMAGRGIRVNGDTISLLLARATCPDTISAVLNLVQGGDSVSLSPSLARPFVEAYLRVPAVKQEEIDGNIANAFEIVDWFFDRRIGVPHGAIDAILEYCVRTEHTEGALRAWREMRRGWLGPPGRKTRQKLWVMLEFRPQLRERLIGDVADAEQLGKLRRVALAHTDNREVDMEVLESTDAKDQAAVLHRWSRSGRAEQAMQWIERQIAEKRNCGVDSRLVLAVLSDEDGGTRNKSLDFCLTHLASGTSVNGNRADVLRRTVDAIWRWILRAEDRHEYRNVLFDDSVDRSELQACLERVVRVKPVPA
ncbi:unnamed protein product [Chondrus crispus]|uniref:Pentacotripeptide-repeat region of PRORP domain-containing protein n=1 Tax=Chondrus crispus TaxID=2769 RepID=R7QLG0_CHOCR|nr:unnamed protein product [Chondrus crispus]CDF39337.1 unnamed protein product [Chondrus crispus]|eukprot:XP_005719248.1 unnamed protein product [Chondrus crispus]